MRFQLPIGSLFMHALVAVAVLAPVSVASAATVTLDGNLPVNASGQAPRVEAPGYRLNVVTPIGAPGDRVLVLEDGVEVVSNRIVLYGAPAAPRVELAGVTMNYWNFTSRVGLELPAAFASSTETIGVAIRAGYANQITSTRPQDLYWADSSVNQPKWGNNVAFAGVNQTRKDQGYVLDGFDKSSGGVTATSLMAPSVLRGASKHINMFALLGTLKRIGNVWYFNGWAYLGFTDGGPLSFVQVVASECDNVAVSSYGAALSLNIDIPSSRFNAASPSTGALSSKWTGASASENWAYELVEQAEIHGGVTTQTASVEALDEAANSESDYYARAHIIAGEDPLPWLKITDGPETTSTPPPPVALPPGAGGPFEEWFKYVSDAVAGLVGQMSDLFAPIGLFNEFIGGA